MGGGSFSFGKAKSKPVIQERPGLFKKREGVKAINEGIDLGTTSLFPGLDIGENRIGDELQNQLLTPKFGADTSSEIGLINSIRDVVQGNAATRGLDVTSDSIAQAIAPTLVDLRQKDIGNLQQQQGLNTQSIADLINALLAKGQLGQVQRFAGNKSNAFNFGIAGGTVGSSPKSESSSK